MYCPGKISSYLEHTIRHTGFGRINFLHQSTGDYIFLETTTDGKGIYFVQRNKDNKNQWILHFPQKDGVVATTDDIANYVQDIRFGSVEHSAIWKGYGFSDTPPYVITAVVNDGNNEPDTTSRRPLQKLINGTWYNIGAL
ncbi:hypothetical protein [Xenorhabdus ishibashii]|uniref:Uncharacterized protein n=1 Tax=Xenorhabdus ishibashii TaxID=1034471 RepID=A0A2D0KDK1_9GAMM|nr:hypothetical protein [Xenorhabdus ishibashii]PHM61511.1 hypothetical protein Xish_00647 [Xenorhabdus ishibashii]